jgi:hypothetical protein
VTGSGPMRRAALFVAIVWALAACSSGGDEASGDSSPQARPSSTATLSIVRPENGALVHGSTVELVLELKGAKIVQATSQNLRPDEGHVHVILDGELISMNYRLRDEIPNVKPGAHILQAEFVANDHAPFDPRVTAVASFEVKA